MGKSSLKKYLFSIPICLLLYIYIYNPVFRILGFSFLKPLLFFSIIIILLNNQAIIYIKKIKIYIFFYCLFFLLTIIPVFIIGKDAEFIPFKHLQALLENVFLSLFICNLLSKNNYSLDKYVIIVAIIAGLISIYLLFNPLKSVYLRTNIFTDSLVDIGYDAELHSFRSFGIAEGLTSTYGVLQGFIAGFCLLNVYKSKAYLIPIPLLCISAFINARTGILVFLSTIPFFIINSIKSKQFIKIIVVICVCLLFFFFYIDLSKFEKTLEWSLSMFEDLNNLLNGKKSGNFDVLSDMFFLPDSSSMLLFGKGSYAINSFGKSSDISLINQLFIGGSIYTVLILLYCFYLSLSIKVKYNRLDLFYLILITLTAMEFKGMDPSLPNGVIRLIFLLLFQKTNIKEKEPIYEKKNNFYRVVLS